jgi:hypothetical protein
MSSRRGFLRNVLAGAGIFASAKVLSAQEMQMSGDMTGMKMKAKKRIPHDHEPSALAETPDVPNLPWRVDGNVKEFHLIAEPVLRQYRVRARMRQEYR